MKKRGFTLIELLAVIVVLAIIALIATPIVMNTIKNSKKGAAERGAENYIKQVETTIAEKRLENTPLSDGTYTIDENGNLTGNGLTEPVTIEMNGTKPSSGSITISNGEVTTSSIIGFKDYEVKYNTTNKKYEATAKGSTTKTYSNGEVVYFNVTTGEKCSDYEESQSNTGVKEGCMKFYAFNDDGGSNVNLLLDHNTTANVTWNSSGSNASGPKDAIEQLKTDTNTWVGTITPENYSIDQSDQDSKAKYTVDYSGYKARLITANEIAQITGNTTWNEKTSDSYFNFDTNTTTRSTTCKEGNTSGCNYGWLYDRTSTDCTKYGCLNNSDILTYVYWTISPVGSTSYSAWGVDYGGSLIGGPAVDVSGNCSIRPVITVSKSQLG